VIERYRKTRRELPFLPAATALRMAKATDYSEGWEETATGPHGRFTRKVGEYTIRLEGGRAGMTRVTLHFDLDEDVTPEFFAQRVAQACSTGALRPGERIVLDLPDGREMTLTISDEPPEPLPWEQVVAEHDRRRGDKPVRPWTVND
jgi:hypothetical protein